jgi:hypothetical protein
MKKIGFIDYYLSEWHANNYPQWIREANEVLGTDYEVAYAWGELDLSPKYGETSAQWCEKMGVELCATIEEVCEKSDVLLILAPSDPDRHLPYATTALRYGKPTYIDKTFAPNLVDAQKIFALASTYNTPFFSTSALRYAEELADLGEISRLIVTGGGGNLPEYLVHQVEMAVLLLGAPAKNARVESHGNQTVAFVELEGGKEATFIYAPKLPFSVSTEAPDGTPAYRAIKSDFFRGLIADILRFYESGKPSFDTAQTLEVMRMRDMILKGI